MSERSERRFRRPRLPARLVAVSWRDLLLIGLPVLAVTTLLAWLVVKFLQPAPPNTIRLISGPENSSYRTTAEKYKAIIEARGVKVVVLPSRGSKDNLEQLANPDVKVDVGLVQSGVTDGIDTSRLVSLGSLFPQPMMVYYRNREPVEILSQMRGKRLAIGPEGSGTRALALKLLRANDIAGPPTVLVDLAGQEAADALAAGTIDAAFLSGDSATPQVMRALRQTEGVALMNFRQANGYVRRLPFLSRFTLPEGAIDLGGNYPPTTFRLVGPTVELVARNTLHPALSDLLISAAQDVHGTAGLFRDAGEYPAPLERDFPISADAERYYKSGAQFLYRHLPFWLASLVDRVLVVLLPLAVLIVPAMRIVPALYSWRVRSRIYRWYGALISIERAMLKESAPEQRGAILARLDEIEDSVNGIKTPLSFADQLYVLREHIGWVRHRLTTGISQRSERLVAAESR